MEDRALAPSSAKNRNQRSDMKKRFTQIGPGIALGAGLGAALSAALGAGSAWLALGIALGIAIGAAITRSDSHKTNDQRLTTND